MGTSVSSAEYIKDVDEVRPTPHEHNTYLITAQDAVVIIDGLTKNFRLPGWRVCWVLGPKNLISALSQSGSFLDGGANHPLQLAAIPLLEPSRVAKEKVCYLLL